jgi:lysophospholipase
MRSSQQRRIGKVMDQVLYSTPGNPAPENRTEGFFETHDGQQLRYAVFRSSGQVAKGTVVILHGRNEYIEKYFETIRDLTAKGLWVATSICAARAVRRGS